MFRPSTTIRTAQLDGNDLTLTVEKPLLLRNGAWYKLSNYNSDTTVDADELSDFGLTHIYQLSKVEIRDQENKITGYILKLLGAADILDTIDINDIAGGSIIDMGYEATHIDYNNGVNNYGIGINSSDNYINLPPRAISLFETVVDHLQDPKVSYRYRGILGTLPDERINNLNVNSSIYQNMRGTQGIYTDNMYLGNNQKYIAFYTENNQKKLRIAGADIVFTYNDGHGGTSEKTLDERIDEIEAGEGHDAINVEIDSSAGNIFINGVISTILRCYVYKGGVDITGDSNYTKTYTWKKINIADGSEVEGWTPTPVALEPNAIRITASDVDSKAVFQCVVDLQEVQEA